MSDAKPKVPAWMVSFGDMMTLILTFFILLVSMSRERQVGLIARGVGSFIVQLKTFGLDGLMSGQRKLEVFNEVRVRFSLPAVESLEDLATPEDAPSEEVLRAHDIEQLQPPRELFQPAVAVFEQGRHQLDQRAMEYLGLLASSLRPAAGQVLVLESRPDRATDSELELATRRANAVRDYLSADHGFAAGRVEVRVWLQAQPAASLGAVDARLMSPQAHRGH